MFETEAQLLAAFDSSIRASDLWLGVRGRQTFMMEEVDGMHGRVDRMMVSLPTGLRPTKARAEMLQQPSCCSIIVALRARQPKSAEVLSQECGRSLRTVRTWLSRMEQESLVRSTPSGGYVLGPRSRLPECEIWCFEGKLRDWQRALYQATRYRAFAHRSLVVMPENLVRTAEAQVERFRLARVGLLSVSENATIRVIAMPRFRIPRSQVMHTMAKGRALLRIA